MVAVPTDGASREAWDASVAASHRMLLRARACGRSTFRS